VHLHGRAGRGEQLVVTEEDYQLRYLSETAKRSLTEDAMRAAFAGSPLLFVGSGLGEDDLVRPLRQFVNDPTMGAGRLAIALLPALDDDVALERTAIRNLQRYGVYSVFYGAATQRYALHERTAWLRTLRGEISRVREAILTVAPFGGLSVRPPENIEGVPVASHPGLSVDGELDLLQGLGVFLSRPTAAIDGRHRATLRMVLQGIEDSIIGAFLCARLQRTIQEWGTWRDEWLALAEPENVAKAFGRQDVVCAPVFRRHHVSLPSHSLINDARTKLSPSSGGSTSRTDLQTDRRLNRLVRQRFDARAYAPTFAAFLSALEQQHLPPEGRRIFLLVTRRGVGKGHFAAGLGEGPYLDPLTQVLDPLRQKLEGEVMQAALFNLSFSHEVSSTFDQLAEFLILKLEHAASDLEKRSPNAANSCRILRNRARILSNDRLGRLEVLLQGLHDLSAAGAWPQGHRMLVVFNRFSVLFDAAGDAKNAQVERIVRLLVDPRTDAAPIDLMLLCSDATLPRRFRAVPEGGSLQGQPPAVAFQPMRRRQETESQRRDLDRRQRAINIDETARRNFVHFLQPARASLLAVSYFPSVALAIALHLAKAQRTATGVPPETLPALFKPDAAFILRMTIRHVLEKRVSARPYARESLPVILAGAQFVASRGGQWSKLLATAWNVPKNSDASSIDNLRDFYVEKVEKRSQRIRFPVPQESLVAIAKGIDGYFRQLFEACGGGRFAMTLLFACAYHHLLPAAEWRPPADDPGRQPDGPAMQRAFDAAIGFLERMRRTLAGLPTPRRDDEILERALGAYRQMHDTPGYPLPGGLHFIGPGAKLFDLLQQILWHLAVIGQPVVSEILAEAPDIAAAAAAAGVPGAPTLDIVIDALVLLEARCLVFEIASSHLATPHPGPNGQTRWAVHRLVQRHVFLTMRAPFVDYGDTDQFALTLYASQPNDVPRLGFASYRRLMDLLSGLTGYPEPPMRRLAGGVWARDGQSHGDRRLRSQMLRAALGVLRASLSLTTLLRLDLQEALASGLPHGLGPMQRGVLDEHRLMLRWLLRQAQAVELKSDDDFQLPLYAEEVVWLHNEIATVAMLQGRMPEAIAHYNRADEAARRHLEPSETGALRVRLALNRAYADIERGRMGLAASAAQRIIAIPDEHKAIVPIAHSVLGLVQHIRGRFDDAETHYDLALKGGEGRPGLLALDRSRASALASKSLGDMRRAQERWEDARRHLNQAYTLALEGGHEDARHLVVLSSIRLDLHDRSPHRPTPPSGIEQHRRLDEADSYARAIGVPQLQCEVAQLRAGLHIRDGDLKTAASVAGAGLSLATVNDLQLRTTGFLLLLSDIYVRRELYREARPLLRAALRMARSTEYHSAHQAASELVAKLPPET
jgi:tetratricopeptide (TPR) repeat protein